MKTFGGDDYLSPTLGSYSILIRLYSYRSDIGGLDSVYLPKWAIWLDGEKLIRLYRQIRDIDGLNPTISPNQRNGWTRIRIYANLGDIGGLLSV
jgi:hypothetical protein